MVSHADDADEQEYLDADSLFHRTLVEASGNLMIADLATSSSPRSKDVRITS